MTELGIVVDCEELEVDISNMSLDESERQFNLIIGHIEDIIMDEKFLELHADFMEDNWQEFENTEENKFTYTDIFHQYHQIIEKYIEEQLLERIDCFSMNKFEKELKNRREELEGEIFEILSTFSDFIAFKSMFLDYREMKEGKVVDFSKDLFISKLQITS